MKHFVSIFFILITHLSHAQSALEVVQKADLKVRGKSSYSEMTISIVRPKWQKVMTMKNWSEGNDFAVSLVTSPTKGLCIFKKRK